MLSSTVVCRSCSLSTMLEGDNLHISHFCLQVLLVGAATRSREIVKEDELILTDLIVRRWLGRTMKQVSLLILQPAHQQFPYRK